MAVRCRCTIRTADVDADGGGPFRCNVREQDLGLPRFLTMQIDGTGGSMNGLQEDEQ
jgi:hypothetical protein